jgi:hypothetical protein
MSIPQHVKDWGGIASAVIAITLLFGVVFERVPKNMRPASEQYVDDSVSPIEQLSLEAAKKGITWVNRQTEDESSAWSPEYIHEEACGNRARKTEGYFRTYERITGSKHPTEGGRCN